MSSLDNLPLSYCTASLGCKDEHTLPKKLDAIAAAGFQAIELAMPDLISLTNQHLKPPQPIEMPLQDSHYDDLISVAKVVRSMCEAKGLKILMLQPFANFEGWPPGSDERKQAFARAEHWSRVMEALGTDMLQIGSTDTAESSIGNDRSRFVQDLTELADILAKKGQRIAYENWCWSTHAPEWVDVWDICQQVNRDNFGLCLDTFQSAGGEWADPTTASGLVEKNGESAEQVNERWRRSCEQLAQTVPKDKIFLLQISDAYKVNESPVGPFAEGADESGMRPRARWSGKYRPLPFEGYLPTVDFTKAVLKTGFRGWFSYEIFDQGPEGKGRDYDLEPWTKAAVEAQQRLAKECA